MMPRVIYICEIELRSRLLDRDKQEGGGDGSSGRHHLRTLGVDHPSTRPNASISSPTFHFLLPLITLRHFHVL